MRKTNWDRAYDDNRFDYSSLAEQQFLDAPDIPIDQFIQFRRIRTKLAILAERGYDIEVMTSEQVYGSTLVAPQKAKIYWSRCEYDFEITQKVFDQIKGNMPLLKGWFTTNLTAEDPKLISVPLGLNDYCDYSVFHKVAGNTDHFTRIQKSTSRRLSVLSCFATETNQSARKDLQDLSQQLEIIKNKRPDRTTHGFLSYLHDLRNMEFVLCPRGNGIDTHRFWEALYSGCIPVVIDSELLPCHKGHPCLTLDTWEQLTKIDLVSASSRIRENTYDLRALCVDYWIDRLIDTYTQ
jgi:hypothetical protein